jgi:hypothetical protein
MRVAIQENYDKMCKWAADYIAAKINNHKKQRPFVLGLPTGSSPIGVYQELVRMNRAGELSFANVETGIKKFGAMLGDYVEVGCNAVCNPGTVIGRHSNIYPTSCVRGVVPENSIWKNNGEIIHKEER